MILGIDHIALSVTHTNQARLKLQNEGFQCQFIEEKAQNHPAKKHLLQHYQARHDLGLFRAENVISIEITNHSPQFASGISSFDYQNGFVHLKTAHRAREEAFWMKVFGFQPTKAGGLIFKSFISSWSCKLKLIEVESNAPYTLDSPGFTCLAFLTKNLSHTMELAVKEGATDLIEPFSMMVNQKLLNITMFRTPTGAICELIQLGAKK